MTISYSPNYGNPSCIGEVVVGVANLCKVSGSVTHPLIRDLRSIGTTYPLCRDLWTKVKATPFSQGLTALFEVTPFGQGIYSRPNMIVLR